MNAQLFVLMALVGWCGTPWPRKWPWPPPPDPDPWMNKVIGVVGGILGGWAISAMVGDAGANGVITAAVGAWVGSNILNDIYGLATGGLKRG